MSRRRGSLAILPLKALPVAELRNIYILIDLFSVMGFLFFACGFIISYTDASDATIILLIRSRDTFLI